MYRNLIAAAFAVATLPALATAANAGTFEQLKRSYTLGCAVNKTDGVSLKSGMLIVTNTSPHTIRTGTTIEIVLIVRDRQRLRPVGYNQVAFRHVPARDTIAFSQPSGRQVVACTAKVTHNPFIKAKIETKIEKIGRR
jgi:hypothetical protein